jgi:hypothetical protein
MEKLFLLVILTFLIFQNTNAQLNDRKPQIMTLGVFHFDYPNLDAVKTDAKDQISVLDEPFQSEIIAICQAIEKFNPTIIAIEFTKDRQSFIDSVFNQYKKGNYSLRKNEAYQLGFRIAGQLDLDKVYCIDDAGKHYNSIEAIFTDNARREAFEQYYLNARETTHTSSKISSITDALYESNKAENIKQSLAIYLSHPFKYEESPGDFTGVDFETGRWYNRNLRIFRNIQRIPIDNSDRILVIIGSEHLNLLNHFFDTSMEFELVSPLPYLKTTLK